MFLGADRVGGGGGGGGGRWGRWGEVGGGGGGGGRWGEVGGGGGGGGGRDRKWVRMPDLSLMLTLIILIMKTGCFSNIIKSLLAVFTYKKSQDM